MRFLDIAVVGAGLITIVGDAQAFGGGGAPQPCTATAPPQAATAAGPMQTLLLCDNFGTNQGVDVNDTALPGFELYVVSPTNFPGGNSTPAAFANDGTGIVIGTTGNISGGIHNLGFSSSPPLYNVGTPIIGSYYIETRSKFNPIEPNPNNGGWNASYMGDAAHNVNGSDVPSAYPFIEDDYMECLPNGGGNSCGINEQLHVWHYSSAGGGTNVDACTLGGCQPGTYGSAQPVGTCGDGGGSGYSGVTVPNINNYNTYGTRYLAAADNNGVDEFSWWINNVEQNACICSVGNPCTCTYGTVQATGTGGCNDNDLAVAATQSTLIQSGGDAYWPQTYAFVHVWQK